MTESDWPKDGRIAYGDEEQVQPGDVYGGSWSDEAPALYLPRESETCPDCQAERGELHAKGCDVEQCEQCGRQRISCECEP